MKQKRDNKKDTVCAGCKQIKHFSFAKNGCTATCQRFIENVKKIFATAKSPCRDLQCRVPGVSPRKRELCRDCPLPGLFSQSLGEGPKCKLGKSRDLRVYKTPWEIARGW